jgi:hypothetical protein
MTDAGALPVGATGAIGDGVGETTTSGTRLDGPTTGAAADDDAGTMTLGSRPVEPRTGPSRGSRTALDDATGAGSGVGSGEGVGCKMIDGNPEEEG